MSKLPVVLQKIFAGALSPGGNIAQPGSTAGGTPIYSSDPVVLQALAAWVNGIQAQLINAPGGLSSPVLEEFNALLLVLSYQIAYLKQAGIAEYDPTVIYYTGSYAQVAGVLYRSRTDANVGNDPTSSPSNWETFVSTLVAASDAQIKAWVTFDGRTGAILESYGINAVSISGSGIYLITFTTPFARFDSYGWSGSAGSNPAVGFLSGDDNPLVGGARGLPLNRSASQCTIYCYDRVQNAAEPAGLISLQFFGR